MIIISTVLRVINRNRLYEVIVYNHMALNIKNISEIHHSQYDKYNLLT
jgi:hypothetical protein